MSEYPAFQLHPLAAQDITDIWEYIADDNPRAARRVREEIFGAIQALAAFPYSGFRRPNLTSRPLRFKLVREYVIAYAPDKKPLWVIAAFHGRRDPAVIAAMLKNREQ
jgi:plasmid stabilization system protein ParE